jgi:hypothetical protein
MNKIIVFFVCFSTVFLHSYEGEEIVEEFFSTLTDIYHPSIEDLGALENFLKFGERPYFQTFKNRKSKRGCANIRLVGENGEAPFHKLYNFNCSHDDKNRCIILYASYNYPYPEKIKLLASELEKCGYRGHLIVRIGGYPNLGNGGLKLAHIPYSWKLASLLELRSLGYQEMVWLDSAMHPLNDLEKIFDEIHTKGYFLPQSGFPLSYPYSLGQHLPSAVQALGVQEEELSQIPHLCTVLIGLNLSHPKVNALLDQWLEETLKVIPCMNPYPEELAFSVVAYRNGFVPSIHIGNLIFTKANYSPSIRHLRDFFWDEHREKQLQWDPAVVNPAIKEGV